jgi:ADP-ribose pyrophosphatase
MVFKGVLFDVYQWNQPVYDGSNHRFEMLKRHPSADILAVCENKILITEEEQPRKGIFPSIPGGGLNDGESPLECAKRELLEETGYEAKEWGLLWETFGASSKLEYHESIFVARNPEKIVRPVLDGGEKISCRWVSFDEFLQLVRNPNFNMALGFKFRMYEALVDSIEYERLRNEIFNGSANGR